MPKRIVPGHQLRVQPTLRDMKRFFSKVEVNGSVWRGTHCWNWTGYVDAEGYPQFWWKKKARWAIRWVYAVFKGTIPAGFDVDHQCPKNRRCVNPAHLKRKIAHRHHSESGKRKAKPVDLEGMPY